MALALLLMLVWQPASGAELRREDLRVAGDAGITLFVRHVAPHEGITPACTPIVSRD